MGGNSKAQRIRDPVHDIIVFREDNKLDLAAWDLIQTPELQRLRRIKQLGVTEFVYPFATHTRFAHSIGVFNYARRLIELIEREVDLKRVEGGFDQVRAKVAIVAAMLHDIGHGPFSHAFEQARKMIAEEREGKKAKIRKHEAFTADMIRNPRSRIGSILADVGVDANAVADLIEAETPADMYHAVVSSSFDADRLDYLQRDRFATGVGAGAIDLEWLMDNVRVAEIDVSPAGGAGSGSVYRHSFCLTYKARDAAEDFILSRFRMYSNVYFHKTTRGMEQLISALFREIALAINSVGLLKGMYSEHPLALYFSKNGETLENYYNLDDSIVWGAVQSIALGGEGVSKDLALRILERQKPRCLDIQVAFPGDTERQRRLKHHLDENFKDQIHKTVFRDSAKLSLYGAIGGDDERAQKRVMIQLKDGDLKEITDLPGSMLETSQRERSFERYYFLSDSDWKQAETAIEAIRGRKP